MVYLLYNGDILTRKRDTAMSFKENAYQQISFTDSFSGLTATEPWDGKKLLSGGYIDVNKCDQYNI